MPKITLTPTVGGYNLSSIDANFTAIADEINNNLLSRNNPTGSPNSVSGGIDMNGSRIYNLPPPILGNEPARLVDIVIAAGGSPDWSAITGKPSTFPPSAHTHPTSDVVGLDSALSSLSSGKQPTLVSGTTLKTVNGVSLLGSGDLLVSGGGGGGDWNTLINKPVSFPPEVHSHTTSDVTGLVTALAGKQDTLSSGVNIKTIDGLSLVGSGNVVTPAQGWTYITGKPSTFTPATHTHVTADVTGLDTALAGKQSTLVSNTNIKTVNGVTLLGSGDIVTNTVSTGGTGVTTLTGLVKGNGTSAFTAASAGTDYLTPSGTETMSNKRVTTRVGSTTSSATPIINTDTVDVYKLTAQAVDITSFTTNLTGTPTDNQFLIIEITGTAARAITWGASFEASTIALPTTTVTTAMLAVAFLWNTSTSKWRCVASV